MFKWALESVTGVACVTATSEDFLGTGLNLPRTYCTVCAGKMNNISKVGNVDDGSAATTARKTGQHPTFARKHSDGG